MEPTVPVMVAAVSAALESLFAHGTEGFAKEAGKATFEATKNLIAKFHRRWTRDPDMSAMLTRFQIDPPAERAAFEVALSTRLERQQELRTEVVEWLGIAVPHLHIVQKVGSADKATGLAAHEINEGTIKIEMDVKNVREITGVTIDKIGR